jgi:hypothetical protein
MDEAKRITTGTLVLQLATMVCGKVDVYGFYPFVRDWGGNKAKYHYYDDVEGLSNAKHDFAHDLVLALKMQEEGLLELHYGACS